MASPFGRFALFVLLFAVPSVVFAQTDDEEPPWSASVGVRYLSRYTAYGIDLGNEQPAAGFSIGIDHQSGLSASIGGIHTLEDPAELQNWNVSAGYSLEVTEWMTISAEYSHYSYVNDSTNVLAALTNTIGVGLDLSVGPASLGVSYDSYLGTNSASYFSLDASMFFSVGRFAVLPLVQATFMSQTIEDRLLKTSGSSAGSGRSGGTGTTSTVTEVSPITGLSSLSVHVVLLYRLMEGLSASFHPYYLYSPKAELSTSSSNFIWSAGLRYSLDF
ncbi:MAG: hypothetical protein MUF82_02105 [Bacteroidetes bacterium]|jgi:hypothetical protein|nr:hypothetical protein [Bacteroidota bacterium]